MNTQTHHRLPFTRMRALHYLDGLSGSLMDTASRVDSRVDTASRVDSRSEEKRLLRWPKNPSDALRQRLNISHAKLPQNLDDQRSFDRGHNRLDERCFEQPGGLPIANGDIAHSRRQARLAGDRHQNQIRPGLMVGRTGDNHGGTLFGADLIAEGKRHQYNITELKVGHTHCRQDCPIWL